MFTTKEKVKSVSKEMATTKEKKNCENKKIKKDVLTRVHGYYQPGNEFDVFLPATAWRFIIFLASAARI